MIVQPNNNIFMWQYDMVIDAANPFADASNIPADSASLSTVIDVAKYRNTFSQATALLRPHYQHNAIGNNNAIVFNGSTTYMTCPYDAIKNGYNGAMTITFVLSTLIDSPGTNNRLFGRIGGSDGFSTGQMDDGYVFTATGFSDATFPFKFTISIPQVCTMRYNGSNSVDFFKNGMIVGGAASDPVVSGTGDLIIGGFNTVLTDFNWNGPVGLIGWGWRAHTDDEIIAAHKYAIGRFGI